MESFTHYRMNQTEQGLEVILYLNENLTEFSNELGTVSSSEEVDLEKEAVSFVQKVLPSMNLKKVYIMVGAVVITTLGMDVLENHQASAAEITEADSQTQVYTVKAGDTLFSIAQRNGTTVDAIKQANGLSSDMLSIGQVLTIPAGVVSTATSTYRVVAGDTLYAIAQRNGTTVAALKQANGLSSDMLSIGQMLRIPGGGSVSVSPVPPSGTVSAYRVVAGDTLYAIAQRSGTTVAALKQANGLSSDMLSIGQMLRIPSGGTAAPAPAPTTTGSVASPGTQTPQQSNVNQEDLTWLAKMIYSEGRGESLAGQIAIGAVIMNRVKSPLFPNNIKDVLFEKSNGYYQFTPTETGAIYTAAPNTQNIEAAKRALNGEDPTNGALFFYNPDKTSSTYLKSRTVSTVIGNHTFAF